MKRLILAAVLIALPITAVAVSTEPAKCFEIAYAHPDNNGFGLSRGQAVRLCSGSTDAEKTLHCFREASTLELNIGLSVELCTKGKIVRQ